MSQAELKNFGKPDEVREFPNGRRARQHRWCNGRPRRIRARLEMGDLSPTTGINDKPRSPTLSVPRFGRAEGADG